MMIGSISILQKYDYNGQGNVWGAGVGAFQFYKSTIIILASVNHDALAKSFQFYKSTIII